MTRAYVEFLLGAEWVEIGLVSTGLNANQTIIVHGSEISGWMDQANSRLTSQNT